MVDNNFNYLIMDNNVNDFILSESNFNVQKGFDDSSLYINEIEILLDNNSGLFDSQGVLLRNRDWKKQLGLKINFKDNLLWEGRLNRVHNNYEVETASWFFINKDEKYFNKALDYSTTTATNPGTAIKEICDNNSINYNENNLDTIIGYFAGNNVIAVFNFKSANNYTVGKAILQIGEVFGIYIFDWYDELNFDTIFEIFNYKGMGLNDEIMFEFQENYVENIYNAYSINTVIGLVEDRTTYENDIERYGEHTYQLDLQQGEIKVNDEFTAEFIGNNKINRFHKPLRELSFYIDSIYFDLINPVENVNIDNINYEIIKIGLSTHSNFINLVVREIL